MPDQPVAQGDDERFIGWGHQDVAWPDRSTTFTCGTCGTTAFQVESVDGQPWSVTCGNGHRWVLVPGEDVRIAADPDQPVAQGDPKPGDVDTELVLSQLVLGCGAIHSQLGFQSDAAHDCHAPEADEALSRILARAEAAEARIDALVEANELLQQANGELSSRCIVEERRAEAAEAERERIRNERDLFIEARALDIEERDKQRARAEAAEAALRNGRPLSERCH